MNLKCPKCNLINKYLYFVETNKGFVCLPCGEGRLEEQLNIDRLWLKNNRISKDLIVENIKIT